MLLFDRGVRRVGPRGAPVGVVPRQILAARRHRDPHASDPRHAQHLRHALADAVPWRLVLRRHAVHRRSLAVAGAGRGRRVGPARAAPRAATMDQGGRPGADGARRGDGVRGRRCCYWAWPRADITRRELEARRRAGRAADGGAAPVTPLVRQVVAAQGDALSASATFRWLGHPHLRSGVAAAALPRPAPGRSGARGRARDAAGRRFLGWARFPTVQVEAGPNGGSLVHLIDLRYADRPGAGFGSVTVAVPVPPTSLAYPWHRRTRQSPSVGLQQRSRG